MAKCEALTGSVVEGLRCCDEFVSEFLWSNAVILMLLCMIFVAVSVHKKHQSISAGMQEVLCYVRRRPF